MDRLGDYRLRKRLAVGGMGEVYLGEKVGPEGFVKPVVIKCVLPQLAKDRAFVQLFLDEARLAALLNHPNIAQVYDFGVVDETYYIAMEYVPGYTVDDIRRKLRSIQAFMPIEHVACIASQVCQGLYYAHTLSDANGVGLGLVHRDVSPHNIMVSVDGGVKLVDFGIAKARAGLTRVQAKGAVGKFGYMSPEQARGEQVDGRSDIFSLGICLWELTTNERLHDPRLDRAPDYSPTRPIRSIDEYRTEIPRQFSQILEQALSIDSRDRYPHSQEMHLALERFQAAMTHYAGQAALAKYIKDLVEGRVEKPQEGKTGQIVEPAQHPVASSPGNPDRGLSAAQKYEEVFGVTMESERRPTRRAVPKSWEMTERPAVADHGGTPAGTGAAVGGAPAKMLELEGSSDMVPDLADPSPRSAPPRPMSSRVHPPPPPRRPRSRGTLVLALFVMGLSALAGSAYVYREPLVRMFRGPEKPKPKLACAYRITTEPAGAAIHLDGDERGATPLELELIPDVEYRVSASLPAYATKEVSVRAAVSTEVQVVPIELEPAATLRVTSVPPGADVSVDGRQIRGKVTPMTLPDIPGGRTIRVSATVEGKPRQTKTIAIPVKKRRTLSFEFD